MPDREQTGPGPLEGLKVVEFGNAMAGPFCGVLLASYGAEVIKVERVGVGDDSRKWSPFFHGDLAHYFASVNHSKKSIALDIKSEAGLEVARKLVRDADIVIDNYRADALEQAGLGYASLKDKNPRLIYCAISGFGRTGPRRLERANDLFMQAFSGGMSVTGEADLGPAKMGISVADIGAGMLAAVAILMALEARHKTGLGQFVETSLFEGQVAMLTNHMAHFLATGTNPVRRGSAGQVGVPYQAFLASDEYLVIAAFNPKMWTGVCTALDKPEWENDPRFCTGEMRAKNRDILLPMIGDILKTDTAARWRDRLAARGVPCTQVNNISDVVADPQTAARDLVVDVDVPDLGPIQLSGVPIKMSENQGGISRPPPKLGQDTRAVLSAMGYSDDAIEQLLADKTVGSAAGY